MATIISKLIDRAIETASTMNRQAASGDLLRNHTNYGALSEIIYILSQIGANIEDCTYADGEYLKCARIKKDNETLINFE